MTVATEQIERKRRKSMNKQILAVAAAVVFTALAPAQSHAQQASRASIPFAFQAGNKTMPAGEYRIVRALPDTEAVQQIRRTDSSAATLVHTYAADLNQNDAAPKLIFHCYTNECFLSEIWAGGQELKLTQSGREKELSQVQTENNKLAVISLPLDVVR
jgi:hypothetical protein